MMDAEKSLTSSASQPLMKPMPADSLKPRVVTPRWEEPKPVLSPVYTPNEIAEEMPPDGRKRRSRLVERDAQAELDNALAAYADSAFADTQPQPSGAQPSYTAMPSVSEGEKQDAALKQPAAVGMPVYIPYTILPPTWHGGPLQLLPVTGGAAEGVYLPTAMDGRQPIENENKPAAQVADGIQPTASPVAAEPSVPAAAEPSVPAAAEPSVPAAAEPSVPAAAESSAPAAAGVPAQAEQASPQSVPQAEQASGEKAIPLAAIAAVSALRTRTAAAPAADAPKAGEDIMSSAMPAPKPAYPALVSFSDVRKAAGKEPVPQESRRPSQPPRPEPVDEDESEEDAVPTEKMAQPVPISFTHLEPPKRKRRAWLVILPLTVLLAIAIIALWQSGYLPWQSREAVPVSTEQSQPVAVDKPQFVQSLTADALQGTLPMTVTFTVVTDMTPVQVSLMDDSGRAINAAVTVTTLGSVQQWSLIAEFSRPYQGELRVFYCNLEGFWLDGGQAVEVDYR